MYAIRSYYDAKHFLADLHFRLGEQLFDLAADHRLDEFRRGDLRDVICADIVRITEHRYAGRKAVSYNLV